MSSLPFAFLFATGALALPLGAQQYNLVELGEFVPGAHQSAALDVNEHGQVVGRLVHGDERRILGFVWERGTVRRMLPQPHDPAAWPPTVAYPFHHVAPTAINDGGIVAGTTLENAGWSTSAGFFAEARAPEFTAQHAIHSTHPLQHLEVSDVSSALPMHLVGTGEFVDLTTLVHRRRGYVMRLDPSIGMNDSALVELGTLGGEASYAEAVNAMGTIVGGATNAAGIRRAFRSLNGAALEDLGTLGGPASHAFDVSASGVIVGWAEVERGLEHAFRWANGAMSDLGTLGGSWSRAIGVDPTGTLVVGSALAADGRMRACLWRDGQALDLNQHVPADLGWTLLEACAVNSAGVIVGRGRSADGREQAFVLEPAALSLAPVNPGRAGEPNELVLEGAPPGALVAFLHGADVPGYVPVPGAAFGGLHLAGLALTGLGVADSAGRARLTIDVPAQLAGLSYRLQAVEIETFTLSDLEIGRLR